MTASACAPAEASRHEIGAASRPRGALLAALGVLAVLTYARGVFVGAIVPPLTGADEQAHFDYVQRLAEAGALPVQQGRCPGDALSEETRALFFSIAAPVSFQPGKRLPSVETFVPPSGSSARFTTGCGPAASYPPAYYATAAATYELRRTRPLLERLRAARLASAVWVALGAAAAFFAGFWWLESMAGAVLLGCLFALQPMILGSSGVVNNDAALFATSAGCLAAVAALRRRPQGMRPLATLTVCAVIGAFSKPTFLLYAPWFFLLAVLAQGIQQARSWWRAAVAAPPMIAVAGVWSIHARAAAHDIAGVASRTLPLGEFLDRWVFFPERLQFIWIQGFWMNWGWTDTFLPSSSYRPVLLLATAGCVGLLVGWRSLRGDERTLAIVTAVATVASIALLYAAELRYLRAHGTAFVQARYLLPLWLLQATVVASGLTALARALRMRWDLAWAFALALAVLDAAAVRRVVERYYGPQSGWSGAPAPLRAMMAAMGVRHPAWPIALFTASLLAVAVCAVALGWRRRPPGDATRG